MLVDHICDAGKSVPTRCPFSGADHAVWLADIQKGLGIQTSDLVGYSLGAYATGLMKLAQPDRVGRLVHAGPAAVYGPFNRWFFARVLVAGLARAWPDVRLARFNTGRRLIVLFGGAYHGWWDGVQPIAGNERMGTDVLTLVDLSPASLDLIRLRSDEIAGTSVLPSFLPSFLPFHSISNDASANAVR